MVYGAILTILMRVTINCCLSTNYEVWRYESETVEWMLANLYQQDLPFVLLNGRRKRSSISQLEKHFLYKSSPTFLEFTVSLHRTFAWKFWKLNASKLSIRCSMKMLIDKLNVPKKDNDCLNRLDLTWMSGIKLSISSIGENLN